MAPVGLDIGSAGLVAAEVHGTGTRRTVRRLAMVDLPPGAVDHGDIRDEQAVVAALKQLWRRGRFGQRRVRIGVTHRQVQVREVTVPALRRADLRRSLELHVAGEFPNGTDGLVVDVLPLDRTEVAGQSCWHGLLVSAPQACVESALDVTRRAGLQPVGADLSALALARALEGTVRGVSGSVALVDVGAVATSVVVVAAGHVRFVRLVALGIGGASQEAVAALVDGVVTTLDYFRRSNACEPVAQVVLTGGGALVDGFGQYLASVTGLPVSIGNPLVGARGPARSRGGDPDLAVRAGVAVGLATDLAA
ncbi:type IV pilus biogenesis protein PilM [Cellulomonas triticagri]|nr:pilus assembly protein PilM [Cellulomonas triticagri]